MRRATTRVQSKRSRVLPRSLAWLFPDIDLARIDAARDESLVLARVLERGRLKDVDWCLRRYGLAGIRAFFRRVAHPEISPRTARFWRVVLSEEESAWPSPPPFRQASAALWPG